MLRFKMEFAQVVRKKLKTSNLEYKWNNWIIKIFILP